MYYYEGYSHLCKYPNFILPIPHAVNNPVTAALVRNKIKMLRNMGASAALITSAVRLAENYDLLIFFNDTDYREE